jgi:hypothetical protein
MPYKNKEDKIAYGKNYNLTHGKERREYQQNYRVRPDRVAYQKRWSRAKCLARYGISEAYYEVMLCQQEGGCAICKCLPETQQNGVLHVDHDHVTGLVRGLLCAHCNQGLGHFRDDVDLMRAAIDYLLDMRPKLDVDGW